VGCPIGSDVFLLGGGRGGEAVVLGIEGARDSIADDKSW